MKRKEERKAKRRRAKAAAFERAAARIAVAHQFPDWDPDVYHVHVHASAALSRRSDALTSLKLARPDERDVIAQAEGEAHQALLSLWIALRVATRYAARYDEPPPLGRVSSGVDEILSQIRNAILHWDGKRQRFAGTFLEITNSDVVVVAPKSEKHDEARMISALSWAQMHRTAYRLLWWADSRLGLVGED